MYDTILRVLTKQNVREIDSIKSDLQNSKTLRNAILPFLVLVVVTINRGEYFLSAIFLSLSIFLFAASAFYRARHTETMYQVYPYSDTCRTCSSITKV